MPEEREDVKAMVQQDTTPDVPQQEKKWRAIDRIVGATFGLEILLIIGWIIAQVTGWNPDISSEHFAQFYFAWGLGFLSLGYTVLILWPIFKKDDDPRWFHARILSSGIVGGSYAFLLPAVMSLPEGSVNSGGAAALRQAILLATGGLIALIALGETRRKNDNDKLKNDREHLRQVRADRRERYTKAVEQLGDEKAPIRMGGVYTLVGLVDEWLEDESIEKYEDKLKEGQVIINNLCAYIRSPFTLTSHYNELSNPTPKGIYKDKKEKFYADKATLDSETDVRLGIIKEIHDRLQDSDKNTPGAWSDFEYDFSGSTFFYPIDLTNSYYAKPINFSGSTYTSWADFSGSTYKGWAYFNGSTYQRETNFDGSIYKGRADFSDSTYKGWAYFNGSTYKGEAYFGGSTYKGRADFSDSTYKGEAYFRNSTYKGEAIFNGSTYKGRAVFSDSTYTSWADFSDSTYTSWAYFSGSTYKGEAYFRNSTYQSKAIFNGSTYKGRTVFIGSIFYSDVSFGENNENGSSSCFTKYTPNFYQKNYYQKTLFGSTNNNFTVDNDKGHPIYLNPEGIPLKCKFLTLEQKEYLEGKFQEIEKINNKLFEVKDLKENEELSKKLQALNEELHKWREEVTTV